MQTVSVGKNGFTFTPDSLVVAAGKQVVFQFYPGDHSVVQAAFDTPCQPANASSFGSGFVNSDSGPAVRTLPHLTPTLSISNPNRSEMQDRQHW
jgi:plastocyanin